jgi:hypothetical protein
VAPTAATRPIEAIECRDAILDRSDPGHPREAEWPEATVVIGNPPFLGGKKMRSELGDAYVDDLFEVYDGRVPREADLVTYWFEKVRAAIKAGRVKRAGLLATNSIRGGASRKITNVGDVYAPEGRPWNRIWPHPEIARTDHAGDVFLPDGLVPRFRRFRHRSGVSRGSGCP